MDSVNAFFHMGGYGGFVWPAYGLTAVVMIGLLVGTLRSLWTREAQLKALQASMPNRRGAAAAAANSLDQAEG